MQTTQTLNFFAHALGLYSSVAVPQADDILGLWLTENELAHVLILKKGDAYAGKITWLQPPDEPPAVFAPPAFPGNGFRPLLGMELLRRFSFQQNHWRGKIYDSDSGQEHQATLWLEYGKLKVRGRWGIFQGAETWTRASG